MHRDPSHPWSVADLGARVGLSRAAFARRFAALVGQPPLAYLTWWRLAGAGRLLRDTDAPLSEIAARVGYGSEFAFANAFKRQYGLAPGRYRRDGCQAAPLPRPAAGVSDPLSRARRARPAPTRTRPPRPGCGHAGPACSAPGSRGS
ncbi:helix-turn-helix transcriptional regulator [Nonomuraea antimicrobica]